MSKFEASAYLILERERYGMRIVDMRKGKPAMRGGQVAVRVKLAIDSTLFESLIPTISAEIQAADIVEPTVEIIPVLTSAPTSSVTSAIMGHFGVAAF